MNHCSLREFELKIAPNSRSPKIQVNKENIVRKEVQPMLEDIAAVLASIAAGESVNPGKRWRRLPLPSGRAKNEL